MNLNVMSLKNESAGELVLNTGVLEREFNSDLVHQVVVAYQAGGRQGTKAQKNRSRVSGGGKKPFRQKGTGRARAGTIRSPIWRSGGVTFAASNRSFSQKVNRKMYRAAMSCILSELRRLDRLVVLESIEVPSHKTKDFLSVMKGAGIQDGLLVVESVTKELVLSSRNVFGFDVLDVASLDPVSLVSASRAIFTPESLQSVEKLIS